jgi:hypothetical protein
LPDDSDSSIVRDVFDRASALAALERAIRLAGGQSALAREATKFSANGKKLTQKTIWKWLNRARSPVPSAEWAVPIEKAVEAVASEKGLEERVTRQELRGDLFGWPLAQAEQRTTVNA